MLSVRTVLPAVALMTMTVAPASAQHHDMDASTATTFRADGLRIDETNPPPGSGVARAGVRLADGGYLHVTYGKPYKRGRVIFGGLVGYGQVWSTGAHIATELVTTVPLTIDGHSLEAGVYSVFTTPGPDRWTLHLNTTLGMHLADEYDASHDVLTAEAVVETLDTVVEGLEFEFVSTEGHGLDLVIRWDHTAVRFPIQAH
ncbi:MAG: DUF2911 domain-containing protein [Gemmatimonadota bacterium]